MQYWINNFLAVGYSRILCRFFSHVKRHLDNILAERLIMVRTHTHMRDQFRRSYNGCALRPVLLLGHSATSLLPVIASLR